MSDQQIRFLRKILSDAGMPVIVHVCVFVYYVAAG